MAYEDVFKSIKVRSGKLGLVYDTIHQSLIGTVAENSFPHNTSANTPLAAAYAKSFDLSESSGTWGNTASTAGRGGYTANFQPFPDADAVGDMFAIGFAAKTGITYIDVSATGATYTKDSCRWEYWNGSAWTTLTVYDGTDSTAQDGKRPFIQDGYIVFDIPSDWTKSTIDSQEAFWIRSYIYDDGVNQSPILEDEHHTVAFDTTFEVPYDCTIKSILFTYVTNSATNNDTIFQLYNLTTGKNVKTLTVTEGKHKGVKVAVDEIVRKDDKLVLFCTQEDGSTEYANGSAVFTMMRK